MMHKKEGNELTKNNACQLFPADRHYSKLLFVCGVLLYLIGKKRSRGFGLLCFSLVMAL